MTEINSQQEAPGFKFVLLCVLVFSGLNFIVGVLISTGTAENAWVFYSIFWGVACSQLTLFAVWCVLAPFRFDFRLLVGVAIAVVLPGVFVFGIALVRPDKLLFFSPVDALLHIPLLSIALQSSLWLSRLFFSWRIVHQSTGSNSESLLFRDILVGSAFIAVTLGATWFIDEPGNAILQAIGLFVFGLATALPAVAALRMRDTWVGIFVFSLPGLAALLMMSVFWLGADSMPIEVPIATVLFLSGFYGSVSCVFIAAKTLGYRLLVSGA